MEKVRTDQEKRSELTTEFFFLRSELTNKKGSELTSGRGPNRQWSRSELTRVEFLGSELTRAELAKVPS